MKTRNNKNLFKDLNLSEDNIEILNYLQKTGKKEKKKNITFYVVIGILYFFLLLGFIWVYKNKDFTYELSGESENFSYNTAIFLKAGSEYCFLPGNEEFKNPNIDKNDIISVTLKSNERLIIGTNDFFNQPLIESKGYGELFPEEVVKNVNDWYLEIVYTLDGEVYTEILDLNTVK